MKLHRVDLPSPLGTLTLVATADGLAGIYFENQNHRPDSTGWIAGDNPHLTAGKSWLDAYFAGEATADPAIDFATGTPFQRRVWNELRRIPTGETITYGECARRLGAPAAVRAVAAAIGRNPLSILIPCHRVLGGNGRLTGYAGGLDRKKWLLDHEAALPCLA